MDTYEIGRFSISVAFRDLSEDRGPALHVHGPTDSGREEVLRFDCFEKEPHYHLAWSYRNDPFIRIEAPDPFSWAVQTLAEHINELLTDAGAHTMNEVELDQLAKQLPLIEQRGRDLSAAA